MKTIFFILFVIGIIGVSEILFEEVLSEPPIVDETRLSDAFENLRKSYKSNLEFNNYNLKDVVVGYGIRSEQLLVTIDERFSHENELDIIKNNIQEIVGYEIPIRFTVSKQITEEDICGKNTMLVDGICMPKPKPSDFRESDNSTGLLYAFSGLSLTGIGVGFFTIKKWRNRK